MQIHTVLKRKADIFSIGLSHDISIKQWHSNILVDNVI